MNQIFKAIQDEIVDSFTFGQTQERDFFIHATREICGERYNGRRVINKKSFVFVQSGDLLIEDEIRSLIEQFKNEIERQK